MLVRTIVMVSLAALPVKGFGQAPDQYRTANSTPQTRADTSTTSSRMAAAAAKAAAAREAAKRLAKAGAQKAAAGARLLGGGPVGAAVKELARPKKACAPAHENDC